MNRIVKIICLNVALLMLVGCADNTNEESVDTSAEESSVEESTEYDTTEEKESTTTNIIQESERNDANDTSLTESNTDSTEPEKSGINEDTKDDDELLSQYSNEQIEYARVWLQQGANQDLEALYVQHIPAGTPFNPTDETSAGYPEDVIQLSGSRLVDGSVTYSGNGDGTINIYNVPLRWDGNYPAGEEFYTEIIENTETVYVDPGNDKEVIELIKLLE